MYLYYNLFALAMSALIDRLNAPLGLSLMLPGDSTPVIRLAVTESSIKRQKQRIIKPTERSYSTIPAFGVAYSTPWHRWELNLSLFMHEVLTLETLIDQHDLLLTNSTQQYLILQDHSCYVNITANPLYAASVIDPDTNTEYDGSTYAFCAFNVYVESWDVDATYANLETLTAVTLVLNEVV